LPKIHVEASTFSRILLASLLLKFGVMGFFRFIFFLKYNNYIFFFFIFFYGFLISLFLCLLQRDLKRQIAFSSISHIRVVFFNLIILNSFTEKFSFLVIIGHAFRRRIIFWFVGELFYSLKTRLVIEVNSIFIRNYFFCLLIF
jgi:NADH:ubiquinone oxidoreductase subunit 4 (subunit M)